MDKIFVLSFDGNRAILFYKIWTKPAYWKVRILKHIGSSDLSTRQTVQAQRWKIALLYQRHVQEDTMKNVDIWYYLSSM